MNANNRWLTPGNLFGALGMLGAIVAAWMSFESRIGRVEQSVSYSESRLERIEQKLDRVIEGRVK